MTDPEEVVLEPLEEKLELKMVIYPDASLKWKATGLKEEDVKDPECKVKETANAMIENLYKYAGIGIAAQQVGVPYAIFVMDCDWPTEGEHNPEVFLNPVIKEYGKGVVTLNHPGEGCLSTPYGFKAQVKRADKIRIEWRNLDWELHDEWFDGVESICIQHELDHLHGILFVDRISQLKRDIFDRKVKKARRHYLNGAKKVKREISMIRRNDKRGRRK